MDIFDMVRSGDSAAVRAWLADGGGIGSRNASGYTAVNLASLAGNREMMSLLLEHGAKEEFFDALALGSVPKITTWLSGGYTANSVDSRGDAPLAVVARQGHLDAGILLLDHGAVIGAQNAHTGNSALMEAAMHGKDAMVRFLLERGADRDARNLEGSDAAILAERAGFRNIAQEIRAYRSY
jgi:ankyrin repeat protein